MKNYIKGNYKRSIYQNSNGFTVGLFKIKQTNIENLENYINKTITFTGYFHELSEEDTYFFYGEEIEHPKYGFQYQVQEYERIKPEDKDSIIEFLASDLFPTIGNTLATSIVNTLGEETLDIILTNPESLNLVPKLTQKKANLIYNILLKHEESNQIIAFLVQLGFNTKEALQIYNYYQKKAELTIKTNIYQLIDDIPTITFYKIDKIAKTLKIPLDDERRIKSAVIYIMEQLIYKTGDTYLLLSVINSELYKNLNIQLTEEQTESYLIMLMQDGKVKIEKEKYYLADIWDAENNIVDKIYTLNNNIPHKYKNLENQILMLEKGMNIQYNIDQKKAIKQALTNNLLIITGGPGTGKTTIIKAIVELYSSLNKYNYDQTCDNIALLAPTGRASKRISESTLFPATTIHRFLKWNKETNKFLKNEYNKDKSQLIIVDEVSMIDIQLLDSLLKGLTDNIQLILVGDYHQLPSVGPGNILKDLIESDVVDTIALETLYRQDENSYITTLAHEIKDANISPNYLDNKSDYRFLVTNNIKENLKTICLQLISKGYNYKQVQLLAPMYKGENGIDNLNKELQSIFNPKDSEKREIKYGDIIFRESDKVLQLVNVPDENIFNGDIGIIHHIIYSNTSKSKKNELYIDFDGNIVKYLPKDFIQLKHGYIISIHKSQGSEFDMVIMPISFSYRRMLYKKLIYTGITRAKQKLIIIGDPKAFMYSVYNKNEYRRNTNLLEKLMNKFNNTV